MFSKQEIKELIKGYDNLPIYSDDEDYLFNTLGKNVGERRYLSREEFLKIVRWKAVRAIRKAEENPSEVIEQITKFAFNTENEETKMRVLTSLTGVSIPMASALLTIPFPNEYGVIDIRAWQSLYELGMVDYQKEVFNLKDWLLYLKIIREASKEWEISPREVDKVLFMYDKVNRKGVLYKN